MKMLKSFSLKFFAILMLFALIACSGDDDSVPQPSVPQPSPADNKIITELKNTNGHIMVLTLRYILCISLTTIWV